MEYRKARPEERGKIIDFINLVFSMDHEPHNFKTLLPKAYGDGACFWPEHYIAVEDGNIEGLVALLEGETVVLGETIRTGIIGSVSVHPYCRSKGHMKKCMAMALEDAQKKGLELMYLGGMRQRYEYFGFTQGGLGAHFGIGSDNFRHGMKYIDETGFTFAPIALYAAQASALQAGQKVHAVRAQENFVLVAQSWGAEATAILKDGAFAGYLIGRGNGISEMVVAREIDFAPALKAWHIHNGCARLNVSAPVWNKERMRTLSEVAGSSSCGPVEMFRLMDLEKNVRVWMELKASYARLADGRFVLEMEGERIAISVQDNAVCVGKTDDAPDAVLSRMEAQDLLLASMRWVDTDAMPACVENWFPLPVSCQSADGF